MNLSENECLKRLINSYISYKTYDDKLLAGFWDEYLLYDLETIFQKSEHVDILSTLGYKIFLTNICSKQVLPHLFNNNRMFLLPVKQTIYNLYSGIIDIKYYIHNHINTLLLLQLIPEHKAALREYIQRTMDSS